MSNLEELLDDLENMHGALEEYESALQDSRNQVEHWEGVVQWTREQIEEKFTEIESIPPVGRVCPECGTFTDIMDGGYEECGHCGWVD